MSFTPDYRKIHVAANAAQHVLWAMGAKVETNYFNGLVSLDHGYARGPVREPGECRYCAAYIIESVDDGAWCDESGACGCGIGEHEPGGFDQYAHDERARETPWWDDPFHDHDDYPAEYAE